MASVEVISKPAVSSKKNKNLEAGRRKLEEFRKKKAQSKNGKSKNRPSADDATTHEKQTSENGQASTVDSVSAQRDDSSNTVARSTGLSDRNDNLHVSSHHYGSESVPHAQVDTQNGNFSEPELLQNVPRQDRNSHGIPGVNYQTGSDFTHRTNYSVGTGYSGTGTGQGRNADFPRQDENSHGIPGLRTDDSVGIGNSSTGTGQGRNADVMSSSSIAFQDSSSNDSRSTSYGFDKDFSSAVGFPSTNLRSNDGATKVHTAGLLTDSAHSTMNFPASSPELGQSHLELKNHSSFSLEEKSSTNAVGNYASFGSQRASEPYSTGFYSTDGGLFNGPSYSVTNESYTRRSRPSFLDSLNIKDSSVSSRSFVDSNKITSTKLPSSNVAVPSAVHNPFMGSSPSDSYPVPASSNPSDDFFGNVLKGHKSSEHSLESKLEYTSQKHNEDFSALEQHIEDLTQEKFSLQRALESSKVLAESLAAENSSLTESYNQQASIVSQLKAEMERLQKEIKARLVELEAIKDEYMNAQLECNAADERAKLLASEVISLEEKALKLRSTELKLERELENLSAEIASYKKKISSLDKERQDFLQTIDALQEEKKLLQSKLRRASASGISIDLNKGHTKRDVSTSTNDIDCSEQASSSMQMLDNVDNLVLLQNIFADQEDLALSIPPDQVQMIQNISSLITEITSEKEELMQALITEVSTSTKLKELNKELSQKLEVQTQRLELLTAQSMASEIITTKKTTGLEIVRERIAYADEGDEVVERVLGWIMKLFPGGPSKRRVVRL